MYTSHYGTNGTIEFSSSGSDEALQRLIWGYALRANRPSLSYVSNLSASRLNSDVDFIIASAPVMAQPVLLYALDNEDIIQQVSHITSASAL
jgi:hypothetical protein